MTPRRGNAENEEYEVKILEYIGEKFKLGSLLRYDSYLYNNITFLVGEYERGKVKVKYKEGKEGLAVVIKYKKVRDFKVWI